MIGALRSAYRQEFCWDQLLNVQHQAGHMWASTGPEEVEKKAQNITANGAWIDGNIEHLMDKWV